MDGVAISSAGVIDSKRGEVIYSGYTIPAYQGSNFKQAIEADLGLPMSILNDVNAAAYGEFWLGDYASDASLICLTIGTGVGGAVLIDGKIHFGRKFSAGEVGYLPLGEDRFQDLASTTALCQSYAGLTGRDRVTGLDVFAAYQAGDAKADQAIGQFTSSLAQGLLPMIYLLNPDAIILGGGVMAQSDILLPKIKQALAEWIESDFFLPESIEAASLGNEAGRLGAVYHFLKEHPELSK
ncbi:ROK family protein [Aerococcus sanguinicola]|uniref:ROK family protein n=1 Tax=Aerococcus TaxID=1375 RepID=UPI00278C3F2C|nr:MULTISPECIES: ROK family protein [Aerococcus]